MHLKSDCQDKSGKDVVVAMSGGVDSAAAALLLCEADYRVVGVSMQVWDYRNHGGSSSRATCCAPADFDDARKVADKRGFPFYVFDFESEFRSSVIDPFVRSYLNGLTPNPCMLCNRHVKFKELRNRAHSLGISTVATGHYARIRLESDGSFGLFTARDEAKDQSYFLYALGQDDLENTLFPVGDMVKSEVRDFLKDRGLSIANKSESQDICFVSGSVSEFIKKERPGQLQAGLLRRRDGSIVGKHEGIHAYTVGQRRGLGLAHSEPLYVLGIDSDTHDVVVGERPELERDSFVVEGVSWVSDKRPDSEFESLVKLRYRHPGVTSNVCIEGDDRVKVFFSDDWTSVCPGQIAVFYDTTVEDDGARRVLGGGVIAKDTGRG